jgi:hypothetical protein
MIKNGPSSIFVQSATLRENHSIQTTFAPAFCARYVFSVPGVAVTQWVVEGVMLVETRAPKVSAVSHGSDLVEDISCQQGPVIAGMEEWMHGAREKLTLPVGYGGGSRLRRQSGTPPTHDS